MDSSYTCLTVMSLDSVFRVYEKYYPQVILKECKYIKKGSNLGNAFFERAIMKLQVCCKILI